MYALSTKLKMLTVFLYTIQQQFIVKFYVKLFSYFNNYSESADDSSKLEH